MSTVLFWFTINHMNINEKDTTMVWKEAIYFQLNKSV